MTNYQGWRHTDVHLLTSPLLLHHLLRLLSDRLQSVDEKLGDTRNQLHHSTHGYTQEQHLLDIQLSYSTNQSAYDNTKHNGLTQHTKLLLQALSVDIELRETWNLVEQPVDANGKSREALAERLWDADAIHIVVITLELLGCQIGHHQRDDVAHDSCEIAPSQTLIHHEICHSTNEGEVPVVPQVDVDRTCTFGYEQQEVHTQTDGNDQCAYSRIVCHSCSSRPTHIEHAQLEIVKLRNLAQRTTEVVGQQGCHNTQSHETDTHVESRFQ